MVMHTNKLSGLFRLLLGLFFLNSLTLPALAQSVYTGMSSYGGIGLKGRAVSWRSGKVSTQIPGLVKSLSVKVGDYVKQGAVIALIDTDLLQSDLEQAQSELAEANANIIVAKAKMALKQNIFARQKRLLRSSAFQKSRYDEARLAFQIAQAEYKAVSAKGKIRETIVKRKKLDIALSVIRAPYEGVIRKLFTQTGAFITPEDPNLVEMIDTKSIEIEVDISVQDTGHYKMGQDVVFQNGATQFTAKVRSLLPSINIRTQTRAVRFTPLDKSVIEKLVIGQEVALVQQSH